MKSRKKYVAIGERCPTEAVVFCKTHILPQCPGRKRARIINNLSLLLLSPTISVQCLWLNSSPNESQSKGAVLIESLEVSLPGHREEWKRAQVDLEEQPENKEQIYLLTQGLSFQRRLHRRKVAERLKEIFSS